MIHGKEPKHARCNRGQHELTSRAVDAVDEARMVRWEYTSGAPVLCVAWLPWVPDYDSRERGRMMPEGKDGRDCAPERGGSQRNKDGSGANNFTFASFRLRKTGV